MKPRPFWLPPPPLWIAIGAMTLTHMAFEVFRGLPAVAMGLLLSLTFCLGEEYGRREVRREQEDAE